MDFNLRVPRNRDAVPPFVECDFQPNNDGYFQGRRATPLKRKGYAERYIAEDAHNAAVKQQMVGENEDIRHRGGVGQEAVNNKIANLIAGLADNGNNGVPNEIAEIFNSLNIDEGNDN